MNSNLKGHINLVHKAIVNYLIFIELVCCKKNFPNVRVATSIIQLVHTCRSLNYPVGTTSML